MNTRYIISAAALAATASLATAGEPSLLIEDGNSSAAFFEGDQISWNVDGVDQIFAQSFFYRTNGMNDESNISALGLVGSSLSDTNPFSDDRDDTLVQLWSDGVLEVETTFGLAGGTDGSNRAGLAEQIDITNLGTSAITLSFFQYVDFDLGDTVTDTGQIVDGNTVFQSDEDGTVFVSETVATPAPDAFQMSEFSNIEDLFGNGVVDNLDGSDSLEAGDVTWAFQWDITLGAGDSFQISKNKTIAPAPGSMALLALGGFAATRRRRA